MNIAAWDWGNLAIHALWLGIGVIIGFWLDALLTGAGNDDDYHRP